MDGQQLDNLLKSRIKRSRANKIVLHVAVALLCLLFLAGIAFGIFYLATKEAPEPLHEPKVDSNTTDLPNFDPQGTAQKPNDIEQQEVQTYTHCLQMVWFEEPLDALPQELEITVLHDGEQVVSFTLTASGGWQHTWTDQFTASSLTLQGDFPKGVFAAFSVSGENFTVTGVFSTHDNTADEIDDTDPEATEVHSASQTENPSAGEGELQTGDEELPRTGLLRWPTWLMLFVGVALLAMGCFWKKAHSNLEL